MRQNKILTLVFALILMLSVAGCDGMNNGIRGIEPVGSPVLTSPQPDESEIAKIIGPGGVGVAPASEEEDDGTMSYGALRLRVEDDRFEFSTDGGQTWRNDWEKGLPDGYSYRIEGDTLEVNTDDGCATMTK